MRGDIREFLKRAGLAYGLVVLLLFLTNAGAIAARRFPDPDDALRLVELRDWLGGQGWFDVTQYRIDPAHGGVAMHWSRLVDVPLAAVEVALRPLLGGSGAELAAMLIVPMLTLAMVLVLVARMAWERLGAEATTLSGLTLAMSVPVVTQIRPMRIDHHGWQVAAAVLALQGVMTRHARIGGWISGAAMAIGLSISLEGLPLTVVFGLLGLWRWLRGGETKYWLAHFAQALLVVSLACFAATRWGDWAQHCDAISPVHLAMFGWTALMLGVLRRWSRISVPILLGGFAVTGAGALALYLGIAPQCRGGSFNMLDPLVQRLWYQGIPEGLPIWRQDWTTALQIAVPPLAGLLSCFALICRSRGEEAVWWQEYALLLGGALAIAVLLARAGAVAGAIAAVPLAWFLQEALVSMRRGPVIGRMVQALALVLALMPAAPIMLYGAVRSMVSPGNPSHAASSEPMLASKVADCRVAQGAAVLARQPRGVVLAPLDLGPDLLLATGHGVMATGHHRGAQAIHDNITLFIRPPEQAAPLIRSYHITYVALCPALAQAQSFGEEGRGGLAEQLVAGRVPDWLEPLPGVPGESLKVWRVRPE